VIVESGSVRGQLVLGEEQVAVVSDMCMHMLHAHVHAHAHCDVWAGAAWADLLLVCCIFLCI
jgi:hypothetical protein